MSGGYHNPEAGSGSSGLTGAEILWVQTGNAGVLLLTEQSSAPSATSGVGKVYTKTDHHLYYKNQSGTETQLDVGAGGGTTTSVYEEVPTDSGSHLTFTLAHTPATTVRLYRGGSRITIANGDFTISTNTITLASALITGETLTADYDY